MQRQKQTTPFSPNKFLPVGSTAAAPGDPVGLDVQQLTATISQIWTVLNEIRATLVGQHKDFHTVEEIADLTGRSEYTVRRWISEGRITATRVHGTGPRGRLLIAHAELSKLVAAGHGGKVPDVAVL